VRRLERAGADGLVLFNRFYQPDLDIENLEVVSHAVLSTSDDLRLPLRWVAILYGRVGPDLALSTGVHTTEDVVKGLMAGAQVTMLTSELLQHGIGRLREITTELRAWLEQHDYTSVDEMRGSLSQKSIPFPAAYERAQYVKIVGTWEPIRDKA
jgi:dihydroorotate dehydrogenase (fumarate)